MNSKYYKTLVILREISVMRRRFTMPLKLVKSRFWMSPSYYPELPKKSRIRIFMELLLHIFRYGTIDWHYFAYGFDIKGFRKREEYMDDADFMWQNNMMNIVLSDWDYTCLLRDKKIFAEILTMWGYQTPHTISVLHGEDDIRRLLSADSRGGYFCKPLNGECGKGTFKLFFSSGNCYIDDIGYTTEDAVRQINEYLCESPILVQTLIEQLPEINAIYNQSINTLRLTTYYDKFANCAVPYAAFFRTGANGNVADNWAIGGLLVNVDLQSGKLDKYAFYKHGAGIRTPRHPNSGFIFEDYKLPFYVEAVQQARELHERMRGIPVIGWDIAFTREGPVFVEGNDNIEMGPIQIALNKGCKKDYDIIRTKCLGC